MKCCSMGYASLRRQFLGSPLGGELLRRGNSLLWTQGFRMFGDSFDKPSTSSTNQVDGRGFIAGTTLKKPLEPAAESEAVGPSGPANCEGCGAEFQTYYPDQTGFIPPDRMEAHVRACQDSAQSEQNPRVEKEVEMMDPSLARTLPALPPGFAYTADGDVVGDFVDIEDFREQDREQKLRNRIRCSRCHALSHYGHLRGNLEVVKADDFRQMLKKMLNQTKSREARCVVLKLVDAFDFEGSLVEDFNDLVGPNHKVILVGNKMDLLPLPIVRNNPRYGFHRVRDWIQKEAKRCKISYDSVELVSAKDGTGIHDMMQRVIDICSEGKRGFKDIYVVGTTNVGKSTLINKLIAEGYLKAKGVFIPESVGYEPIGIRRRRQRAERKQQNKTLSLTTSFVPGTTMGVVSFPLSKERRITLFDTPGVINNNQLLSRLRYDELVAVMPKRRVRLVTFRVPAGKSLLLGSLACIDVLEGRTPFLTIAVAPDVSLHVTDTNQVEQLVATKAATPLSSNQSTNFAEENGNQKAKNDKAAASAARTKRKGTKKGSGQYSAERMFLSPPFTPERVKEVGLGDFSGAWEEWELSGKGWMESCADVVFPGLGWVAVTTSGSVRLRTFFGGSPTSAGDNQGQLSFPDLNVSVREPLMPKEVRHTMKAFTGINPAPNRR